MPFFGSLKIKQYILSFQDFLTDPYVTSRDLQGRKTILVQRQSSSEFKSSLQHAALQFRISQKTAIIISPFIYSSF